MSQKDQQQAQRPEEDEELIKYADIFSRIQENVLNQSPQVSGDQSSEGETKETGNKEQRAVSIGDALEAAAITAGQKAVDRSDAAAIQAVEVRATGQTNIMPKGLAATAQSAAQTNARTTTKDKVTLAHILLDAKAKLPKDRAVTRQDAQGVVGAELRNNPNIATYPGGVAASMVAAARINQNLLQSAK
ncbi:late embryogenesis abundant protein 47 [Silene latifolia]|uniref:late embryogenesis abundant protein 47 n=1 Tax=Silene latifolia TaxID=37657 RepID=UPI003D76C8E9